MMDNHDEATQRPWSIIRNRIWIPKIVKNVYIYSALKHTVHSDLLHVLVEDNYKKNALQTFCWLWST